MPEDEEEEGEIDGDMSICNGEASEEGKDCEDRSEQDQEEGVQEELAQDVEERFQEELVQDGEERVQEEPKRAQEEKPRAPCKVPSFEIFAPVEVNSSDDEAPAPTPTLNPIASGRMQKLKELQARLTALQLLCDCSCHRGTFSILSFPFYLSLSSPLSRRSRLGSWCPGAQEAAEGSGAEGAIQHGGFLCCT